MDSKTLIILNKLQNGKISYKKACNILNKTEKEIDALFDSSEYKYLPSLKEEKKLYKIEKKNVLNLVGMANIRQNILVDMRKLTFPKVVVQIPSDIRNQLIPNDFYIDSIVGNLKFEDITQNKSLYRLN